ncbi:MAG: Vitamin K epoxide reductase [Candidatus Giovannonibacteria bacterium GW2011_GWA2_44_13b]|uniref:Vitamin K epoxide reductase n=2 Tax=Candidatus Giovannoniibacteriota TaxID=1752738 RepID=A0A0G1JB22_9BACT|nr:MAG: Vitamin K epoxide reductase [Candidatus Giovannonibacteria bacterium GW2011_GWA2_44_13b]OGF82073.1 MAG: hypothetical protein A2924_01915 [Candidatus Giovannonibacteria bacterium RIFCSPLOWO2_01_FULL_44_16]
MDKAKILIIIFIAVAFIGFLDASFLTIEHYQNTALPCVIFKGCEQVTTSAYSELFGLPLALYGAAYYLFMLLVSVFYFDTKNGFAFKILKYIPVVGFLASAYFVYLQLFVIHAICTYCVISAVTSTTLFILSFYLRE